MAEKKQGKQIEKSGAFEGIWNVFERLDLLLAIATSIFALVGGSSGNTVSLEERANQGIVGQITAENDTGQSLNVVAGDGARIIVQDPSQTQETQNSPEGQVGLTVPLEAMTPEEKLAFSADKISGGEYEQAVYVLSEVLGQEILDPSLRAVSYYNRGLAHFHLGEYAQAQIDLERSVAINGFSEGYYNLGVLYDTAFSDPARAIAAYSEAIKCEENAVYYLARAVAHEQLGQYQAAQQDYRNVLCAQPQNAAALAGMERVNKVI